ncbi:ectonucleotide pyrophosphatase/phosphodiesterase family member 3 isoform X3 [Pteropus medius]|uniref:ectonucleotide pyrophosphatase/phosphodiesterase family member 3 isoform X3 n=1 Tax=Pteropus vampyrus TaxID=132908 RepID=UPI00196B46B7|nr:ectonucleotide pyrophosphatase/phosphodiesterase family member 3 isoform X3 [Pteropus giganteus]
MDSQLTLSMEKTVKESTVKKYRIICIVLLVLLVFVTLGLGLQLGLRKLDEQGSCRKRCFDSSYRALDGCRCDMECKDRGNCCWDFEDTCVKSTQIWTCNKFRCGETRLESSLCSCSDDCLQRKDCCVDYKSVCQGETSWVKANCSTAWKSQCPEGFDLPPVILFSMDGFRAEYLQTWSTLMPNIDKMKTCGIHSKYLRSVYPTKTFPNHYTIVTGLYPESHGIIDNNMYDVNLNKNFSLSSKEKNNPAWWQGQPIWLTAMYQGLKAGTYFWPGSDVAINGSFPTIYVPYESSVSYEQRISTLLKWLDLPQAERPSFYTLYVEQPDSAGHESGPVSANCQKPDQHFKPYLTPDLPKRLHFAKNVRIDKAHLLMDRQWLAMRSKSSSSCGGGTHGFDNKFKAMEALFLAHGPSFKEKTEVEPFDNIEVYNLICDLLHIQPAPNNGTHGSLNHLLKVPFYEPSHAEEVSKFSVCGFTSPLPTDTLDCSCPTLKYNASEEQVNQMLNLTQDEITATEKLNLPFGRPRVMQENKEHCLLYHREYVSGFGKAIRMPMWSSYTVPKPGDTSPLPPTVPDCLRADVRVAPSESQKCSFYLAQKNITHGFLYPPGNNRTSDSQYDALITSNLVPMYEAFKKIWDYFHNVLLVKYAMERNGVNVVSGPVFDYNYDGRFDAPSEITEYVVNNSVPIPTHYFVMLTSCKNKNYTPDTCPEWLDVLSFIIPHHPTNMESCPEHKAETVWIEERVKTHVARVRDVELLTGLDFFQEKVQPVSEILQLKTYLPTFETII